MKRFEFFGMIATIAVIAAPAAAQMHGQTDGPIEVPLRAEHGVLSVTVESSDGQEFDFILGTASGATVLSESAKALIGSGTLSMAGVSVPTGGAQDVPDSNLEFDGKSFDGMIGANTLNPFDVLVDAAGGRLVLKAPGRSVSWEGIELSPPQRARVMHGMIVTLQIDLNGQTTTALLDLGTSKIVLSPPLSEKTSYADETMRAVSIGDVTFADVPISVREHPVFQAFDPQGNGFAIVGAPVALDCAISISYVHQEVRTCVR